MATIQSQNQPTEGLSACCMSGTVHQGTPKGHIETLYGRETYVTKPESGSKEKTIVFIADIFGYKLPNSQLYADQLASAGFNVLIPDFYDGDALPIEGLSNIEPRLADVPELSLTQKATNEAYKATKFMPFAVSHREAVMRPKVDKFIDDLRTDPQVQRVGAIGFCWGGRHSILLANEGSKVDVCAAFHPSATAAADYEKIDKPITLGFGTKDTVTPMSLAHEVVDILGKKTSLKKEIRFYDDQVHGFALRGDWSSEKDKKAMDEAQEQAISWFKEYL